MPPGTAEFAKLLGPVFERTPAAQSAYLFGSQADGSAGEQSDVDIGVITDGGGAGGLTLRESAALELELGTALGNHSLDLVVVNRAPLPLRHRILSTGTVLFSRDEARRTDFVEQVTHEYVDVESWLRRTEREYLEALAHHHGVSPDAETKAREVALYY